MESNPNQGQRRKDAIEHGETHKRQIGSMNSNTLVAALDRFLEAVGVIAKERVLGPIERKLEAAMQRAFALQERAFLRRFARLRPLFAEALREALADTDWGPSFDDAAKATANDFINPINVAVTEALAAGGEATLADLMVGGSFDLANPRAVAYLRDYGAKLVAGIDDTTRAYIRTIITEGVDKGWSYNQMAKAISDRYAEFRVGRPQAHIASRAHMVAVTESGNAYSRGNAIVAEDLAAAGLDMEKHWVVTGGEICELCLGNEAQGWIPLAQAFSGGVMEPLQHPACIAPDSLVWAFGIEGAYRAHYVGPMVELSVADGMSLTISPNHPVATPDGWVVAGSLHEGDYMLGGLLGQGESSPVYPNVKLCPTRIDKVFGSLLKTSGMSPIVVPASAEQFHGDGVFLDGQVDIVGADRLLARGDNSVLEQPPSQQRFARCGLATRLYAQGLLDAPFGFRLTSSHRGVCLFSQSQPFVGAHTSHAQSVGFRNTTRDNASSEQAPSEVASIYSKLQRQLLFGNASLVSAQRIIEVRRVWYSGHVYDLQSLGSLYNANGVYVHNCRCAAGYRHKGAGKA